MIAKITKTLLLILAGLYIADKSLSDAEEPTRDTRNTFQVRVAEWAMNGAKSKIEKTARNVSRKLGKRLEEISEKLNELNEYEAKDIAAKESNK